MVELEEDKRFENCSSLELNKLKFMNMKQEVTR